MRLVLAAGLLAITFLSAQAPTTFEVASIRASAPGKEAIPNTSGFRISGTNVTGSAMTVMDLISYGYSIGPFQLGSVPKWVKEDRWNIQAKTPGDSELSRQQIRAMIKELLADRFQLRLSHEMKEMSVYRLIIGNDGSKLRPLPDPAVPASRRIARGDGIQEWAEGKQSIETLVGLIMVDLGNRPVVNGTGLSGFYVFGIHFVPDRLLTAPTAPAGPSIFKALEDQLGLKLEAVKMPIEYFTVERVERPSEN